jgi:tRNA(Ile)-lysidine synthase
LAAALAAIGGFETRPGIAIAVSGGPDSMALALLADRWARQRGGQITALHVDHGLRPESADEALVVAGWLAARGIPCEILAWHGAKPATGIQEAAREARYHLLAKWCCAHGCLHLLTAHHRDDQIETHLIRRRAGSGMDGLAGMSAVRELPGCRLVRPLLSVPRARLAAFLAGEDQPSLHDPSNANPVYERARLRAAPLTDREAESVADELHRCAALRIGRERDLNELTARSVTLHPAGFAAIDAATIANAESEIVERLLGRVASCIGVAFYPLRQARLATLRAALSTAPERARTLGGCRFVPWRGRVLVLRELRAASAPVRLEPGTQIVWDRRFVVSVGPTATNGLTLGYLGQNGGTLAPQDVIGELPRLIRSALPAVWDEAGLAAVPHLGYRRPGSGEHGGELPCVSVRPAQPLARVGFTVV